MNINPAHSVADGPPDKPHKSLSPSIVAKFSNISFQKPSPTQTLFTNHTITNTDPSPRAQSLPSNTFTNHNDYNKQQATAPQSASQHVSQLQSDYSSLQGSNQTIAQTEDTNQENMNPNAISTSNQNHHSPKQTAQNIAEENSTSAQPKPTNKGKSAWKKEFNKLIREAKAFESSKEHLLALKTYIKATKLSPKTHKKLLDKIERVQDRCYELELHETEDAFEQIQGAPWYLNIVTDNYHIERAAKDEDQDEESWDDDEEELEYVLPGDIYDKLYDYQRECLVWFWKIYQTPNGGILGDDMGLGKTVQMSAFLNGAFQSGLVKSCILIVPVSVMSHWIKELNIWCDVPGFRIRKYHSSITKKRRAEHLATIAKRGGILITTYGMVQKNFASMGIEDITKKVRDGKVVKEGRKWDYMILDEGHKIKNHLIGTSKAVRQVPVKNSNKIILSGTFLQNELSELWSLFDFISEGSLFGSYRAFNEEFATKINAGRLKNASLIQKQISNKLLNLIKNTVKPYLLRRTKAEIRQKQEDKLKEDQNKGVVSSAKDKKLTPVLQCQKRELVIWITMSSIQVELYQTFLESEAVKETLNTTKSPLAALTVLKKICDHPFLISDKMANCSELTRLSEISRDRSIQNTLATSHKMGVLISLLKHLIDNKHRILVFSQYKIILSMIEPILNDNKIQYLRMDGDTPVDDRQKFVNAFNSRTELQVFLLSTRVGGLGLNLVGSDRVIIYDPAWNPANDAQAVDRSYRIGQTKDVMVYRFVTCGTIEEKIYRRQISKVGLLKSVTGQTNQHRYFSKAELKEVFKLENPEESQTQIQFKELHAHRIGTNAAFDTETNYVEHIQSVYGISHHDLLFRTCPKEELEENPELMRQMEEYKKKLTLQTPKPRTTRKRKPQTKQKKITDLLEGRVDLSAIMPKNNNDRNKNIKRTIENQNHQNSNNHSHHNILNSSNSMDIDDEDEDNDYRQTRNDMANVSFISNVSSIHSVPRHEDHSNSWTDNQCLQRVVNESFHEREDKTDRVPMSTAKKTRTLRKKQNRFIADSESDEANDSGFNAFPQNRTQFDFSSTTNIKSKPLSTNVILQTPIFRRFKRNEEPQKPNTAADIMEDHGIDMTDIVKAIRSQPRRKRRKSMANLKQLLDAQESDHNEEEDHHHNDNHDNDNNEDNNVHNEDAYDSEATVSEEEGPMIPTNQDTNPWQTQANQSISSRTSPTQPLQSHNTSSVSILGACKESSISKNNSFIFDNNRNDNDNDASYDSKHNESTTASNPYLDDELINNLQSFSVQQNKSFEQLHQVHDNHSNNALNQPHSGNEPPTFTPNTFSFTPSTFTPSNEFNSSAVEENRTAQLPSNENEEYDDEETVSDEEMLDLSNEPHSNNDAPSPNASTSTESDNECVGRALKPQSPPELRQQSVTALEIFQHDEIEKKEEPLSAEPQVVEPLQSVSPQKVQQVAKRYKRYRRKSFIPQIEDYDNVNNEDEEEDEEEEKEQPVEQSMFSNGNNNNNHVTVCDEHRRRANGVESFEYKCTKCECHLSENEKAEYYRSVKMADEAEQREEWIMCMELTMKALQICNSDPALHAKCVAIAEHLGMCN